MKGNTFSEDEKIAETFNKFFGNIIKNLNISINSEVLEDVSMIQDPIIAAIKKYKRHPSILKIKKHITVENYFDFKHIDDKKMAEVLKFLNAKNAKQENDIPIKLIKENIELFSSVCSRMFNFYIDKASFPNSLKQADVTTVHKKMKQMIKTTTDQPTYYLLCLRLSKSVLMIKFMLSLIVFFLRPNAALEKATVLSIQLLQ